MVHLLVLQWARASKSCCKLMLASRGAATEGRYRYGGGGARTALSAQCDLDSNRATRQILFVNNMIQTHFCTPSRRTSERRPGALRTCTLCIIQRSGYINCPCIGVIALSRRMPRLADIVPGLPLVRPCVPSRLVDRGPAYHMRRWRWDDQRSCAAFKRQELRHVSLVTGP